jgi:hypothetical protein
MSKKQSFLYKTVEGVFFHISEVTSISAEHFKDEDGTLAALKGTAPSHALFIKLNGDACVVDLDDDFNKLSAGQSLQTYYSGAYEPSIQQKVERVFVETWGLLKYPDFGGYDEWKEQALKTRR